MDDGEETARWRRSRRRRRRVRSKGDKPKHSMSTVGRTNNMNPHERSAATVRRLAMYKQRAVRDKKGKILKQDLQSKELRRRKSCPIDGGSVTRE